MRTTYLGFGVVLLAAGTCLACGPADPADQGQADAENVGSTQEQLDFINLQASLQRQSSAQQLAANILKKKAATEQEIVKKVK